jgi:hypothetical protein
MSISGSTIIPSIYEREDTTAWHETISVTLFNNRFASWLKKAAPYRILLQIPR